MSNVQPVPGCTLRAHEVALIVYPHGNEMPLNPRRADLPKDPFVVLDCPICGRQVDFPGTTDHGLPMAECDHCDIYFDFKPEDISITRGMALHTAS
jgi:hypothetical protein